MIYVICLCVSTYSVKINIEKDCMNCKDTKLFDEEE